MVQAVPIAQNNAIEASVFTLRLSRFADIEAQVRLDKELTNKGVLPGRELGQGVAIFQMETIPSSPPAHLTRFEARTNGSYAWSLQLHGPFLTVACYDYTHFEEVWGKAKDFLMLSLQSVGDSYEVEEVTHQVVDRFVYDVPLGEDAYSLYKMEQIFRPETPYLTQKAWNSGLLWHVHQGWFEDGMEGRGLRHLHQVNISNSELEPQTKYSTVIDHRGTVHSMDSKGSLLKESAFMDEVFHDLHERNLKLIHELLCDDMQAQINLRRKV